MALTFPEFLVVCGSLSLIGMLVSEIFEWIQLLIPWTNNHQVFISEYDYSNDNQSSSWRTGLASSEWTNQSPINIVTRDSIVLEASDPLKWMGYSVQPVAMTMLNDGKTISVQCVWPADVTPYIEAGPLRNLYDFHSILFHWGPSDDVGSEHALDDIEYPLEMQLVHIKTDLESLHGETDVANAGEIAIISFFFMCSEKNNCQLENIITSLSLVKNEESKVSMTPFSLDTIFPMFKSNFYTYNGSSSALPFIENVVWMIHPEPLNISRNQMDEFRKISSLNCDKFRDVLPCQPLNDRAVYFYE